MPGAWSALYGEGSRYAADHPDRYAGQGALAQKQAEEKFKTVNSAYERIKKERNY